MQLTGLLPPVCTAQDYLSKDVVPTGLGLLTLIINQEDATQICQQANWIKAFSLFLDDHILCQVDKQNKNKNSPVQ